MRLIGISSDPTQQYTLALPDGTQVTFSIRFSPNQKGWFYSLTATNWESLNRRLVVSQNMLRQYRNILAFGLACFTTDGYEPIYQDDFLTGRAKLYLLTQAEAAETEVLIGAV